MPYRILIADDMLTNRRLIRSVLKRYLPEAEFCEAEDGNKALECIFGSCEVDLIILDLIMPGKDGFDVIAEAKAVEPYCHIPIIVNSAVDDIGIIQRALEAGATDYFTKPLSMEEIDVVLPLKVKNAIKAYEQTRLLMNMNERMVEELRFATMLQHILISESKELQGVTLTGRYLPSTEVGGDFYDCVRLDNTVWFIIADVCGHGVAAAMISSMVKTVFHSSMMKSATPDQVLHEMNQTFLQTTKGTYHLTAFVGMIKEDTLSYANAGHPYPMLLNASGEVYMIEQNGFVVGIFEDAVYTTETVPFGTGSMILLYTDGLLEPGEGMPVYASCEDVFEAAVKYRHIGQKSVEKFIKALLVEFDKLEAGHLRDDVAIMMIFAQ